MATFYILKLTVHKFARESKGHLHLPLQDVFQIFSNTIPSAIETTMPSIRLSWSLVRSHIYKIYSMQLAEEQINNTSKIRNKQSPAPSYDTLYHLSKIFFQTLFHFINEKK